MDNKPFVEYILRDSTEPLLQGDIFSWKDESPDPWKQFGVIVTGDCDLVNNKFGESMSYCPIIRLHDFLRLFWVSKDLEKVQRSYALTTAQQLTKARIINRPEYSEPINADLLPKWLEKRGVEGLLDDIKEPAGKQRIAFINKLNLLKELIEIAGNENLQTQITTIAKAKQPITHNPIKEEEIAKSGLNIWKQYSEKVSTLQGDLFFLNEISPLHTDGYIVYLRRIAEILPGDIAINPLMKPSAKAVRISHLRSVLKYRITQKLAAVFSDIGLPTEYETMCKEKMNSIGSLLNIKTI